MNKKGFTLVELLGVIAILAIIIGISFAIYTRVRNDVLNQELANVVSYIEAQAENYANDTNITVVSVEDLILDGYIEPDDETDIYSPVTGESLNCYLVRSTYEDGEFTSVLDFDSLLNRDETSGTCDIYASEVQAFIGVQEITDDGSVEGFHKPQSTNGEIKWYKNDLYLAPLGENNSIIDIDGATYEWRNNYGEMSDEQIIRTEVSNGTIANIPYTVAIRYMENESMQEITASETIHIDKEAPRIIDIEVPESTEWTISKTITIKATDGSGSGIAGIYYGLADELSTCTADLNYITDINGDTFSTDVMTSGIYRACAIDKVGNVSEISDEFIVSRVDGAIDTLTLTGIPEFDIVRSVELRGQAQDDGVGLVNYGHFDNNKPTWQKNFEATNELFTLDRTVSENGLYYFCAIDGLDNEVCVSYRVSNIDNTGPNIDITKSTTNYATSITLTITASDIYEEDSDGNVITAASGIDAYRVVTPSSSGNWISVDNIDDTETFTTNITANNNGTYYFYVRDKAGNETSKSINVNNIIVLTSRTVNLYSRDDDYISQTFSLSGIIQYDRATIVSGGGTVSGYKSGNGVRLTVSGGNKYTGKEYQTFTENPDSYRAHEEEYCSGYYCPNGGDVSGSRCVGSDYYLYGWNDLTCQSSGWWNVTGYSDRYCEDHYYKNDFGGAACPTDPGYSCTSSVVGVTERVTCRATCEWLGNYSATCEYYDTEYYCNPGDERSGSYCYTCTRGDFNRYGECEYETLVNYAYYEYDVIIYYYVLE